MVSFHGNPVYKRQLQYLFKGALYCTMIHCSEWKLFSGVFPHLKTGVCSVLWEPCSFFSTFWKELGYPTDTKLSASLQLCFWGWLRPSLLGWLIFNSVDFFILKKCWFFLFTPTQYPSSEGFVSEKMVGHSVFLPEKVLNLSPFAAHLAWHEHLKSSSLCSVQYQTKKGAVDEWCLYRWKHAHCINFPAASPAGLHQLKIDTLWVHKCQ